MLEYLEAEANLTFTENDAITYRSTLSECLDLFATVGALRRSNDNEIISRFIRAYSENKDIAMKLLFFARDIRGGLGERRVFRTIIEWLSENEPQSVLKNLRFIADYGRFDDLLVLFGTPLEKDVLQYIKEQLNEDTEHMSNGEEVSLLAKWLPSVNTSSIESRRLGKKIARALGLNDAEYRKKLVSLRRYIRIIENNLPERDYTFDYAKQPSKALFQYRNAFIRNNNGRYQEYLNNVNSGDVRLNASTFSENPQLVRIPDGDILDKLKYCHRFNELAKTDIQKVFELILNAAKKNNVSQSKLPSRLYIISDMEFDHCAEGASITNFEYAKKQFEAAGYKLPEVVFWNVDSHTQQRPLQKTSRAYSSCPDAHRGFSRWSPTEKYPKQLHTSLCSRFLKLSDTKNAA